MKTIIVLSIIITSHFCVCFSSDIFTEELLLKPLYNDKIYAHFQFRTKWDVDPLQDNSEREFQYHFYISF